MKQLGYISLVTWLIRAIWFIIHSPSRSWSFPWFSSRSLPWSRSWPTPQSTEDEVVSVVNNNNNINKVLTCIVESLLRLLVHPGSPAQYSSTLDMHTFISLFHLFITFIKKLKQYDYPNTFKWSRKNGKHVVLLVISSN